LWETGKGDFRWSGRDANPAPRGIAGSPLEVELPAMRNQTIVRAANTRSASSSSSAFSRSSSSSRASLLPSAMAAAARPATQARQPAPRDLWCERAHGVPRRCGGSIVLVPEQGVGQPVDGETNGRVTRLRRWAAPSPNATTHAGAYTMVTTLVSHRADAPYDV